MVNRFKVLFLAALMLVGVSALSFAAGPSTTTVGLKVVPDVSQINATGTRTVNLSIMGLDEYGNVDTMGEAGGATIIAAVQSVLGTVNGGGATPGGAAGGAFATSTRYVLLNQGNGRVNITYNANVSGTDTITVILMKRWTEVVQSYTEEITRTSLNIEVEKGASTADILHIRKFTKANSDTNGLTGQAADLEDNVGGDNEAEDNGIAKNAAKMTAGIAGGTFEIHAYKINQDRSYTLDTTANGIVTVTLTGTKDDDGNGNIAYGTTYSFNGTMSQGVAHVSVPATVVKAGVYKVVATLGNIDSVPNKISDNVAITDYLTVLPDTQPVKVGLEVDRSVVSNTSAAEVVAAGGTDGFSYDPTFTAYLLDKYGNKLKNTTGAAITVKVTDANAKIADFNITINNNAKTGTAIPDSSGFTAGLASLTASVPANTSIQNSDPVSLKIVAGTNQLIVNNNALGSVALGNIAHTVGQTIVNFFQNNIGVDNGNGGGTANNGVLDGNEANVLVGTNKIKITNLTTKESITVGVKDNDPDNIDVLFTKPTTNANLQANGFLVEDPDGSYAGFIIKPSTASNLIAINTGSPVKAYIKNEADDVITEVVPEVLADGSFRVIINGARVSMTDSYGNPANAGQMTISTTRGTATGTITVGNAGTQITITYPAGTTGEDKLDFNFTAPGIQSVNDGDGLTVKFPTVSSIDHFDAYVQDTTLPINGIVPLTVIARDVNGNPVVLTNGFYVDYDNSALNVRQGGVLVAPGSSVCANNNRCVLEVDALTNPGAYTVTIKNADGSVTKDVEFNIVEYTASMSVSASSVSVTVGNSTDITVSGGMAPYTVNSSDTGVATATISDNTVTITGVAAGSAVITVSDSNGQSITISVTVQGIAQPQPVPTQPTAEELTGDEIANAPVNLGPVATGGDKVMEVAVNFPPYENPVDIYVGILMPDGTLYILDSNKNLITDVVPFATNTTEAVSETIFDSFPVCTPFGPAIPTGTYNVYSLVVPAGSDLSTMDWTSDAYTLTYYSFDVNCD